MNKAESIDRELVLRVAGEPRAWAANEYIAAGNTFPFGFTVSTTQKYTNQQALYTEAQLLAVAEAMIAVGAEDRREHYNEVLIHERDHAKACYDRAVRILAGIHALLYPPRFADNDGRTWQFKSPLAEEQMQELSDRIRAIPDEISATESTIRALPVTQANPEGEKA